MEKPMVKPMEKTFELLDPQTGNLLMVLHNSQPRGAALKAAGDGVTDIILRQRKSANKERATKLHRFKGSVKPDNWTLPLPSWKIVETEKKIQKKIPHELNAKGKEAEWEKAGFALPFRKKPIAKKICSINVPKIEGVDIYTEVKACLKSLPKVA